MRTILPLGTAAWRRRDATHYGFINVTSPQLKRALRQSRQLAEFAEDVLLRSGSQ